MTSGELITLDNYIRQNRSFVIYRIPGEESHSPRFLMQSSGPLEEIHSLKELNGKSGFVMAPFHITPEQPAILIRPDICNLQSQQDDEVENKISSKQPDSDVSFPTDKKMYKTIFDKFLQPLQEKELQKVVLSRKQVIPRPEPLSPAVMFKKACERYTRSYVYLCHTPITGTWLGSTPEMLLSGEGSEWHTVALAGTTPLVNGSLPATWSRKNREEQKLVASYITGQLQSIGITATEAGPYSVRAAHLAHLKSDFHFTLADTGNLGTVLDLLHPTPAIAGIPKQEAIDFILRNEGYNRSWYSGFLGTLNPIEKSELYVNLRCMQIKEQSLILYAGSGLLDTSSADEEWNETSEKLKTMSSLIDN